MNSLTIIGNVSNEPELRSTQAGVSVCSFNVAVNNKYKPDDDAIFFRVSTWRKLAENCGKFVKKGMKVAVHGSVAPNEYEVNGEKRFSLAVQADDVEFLSKVEGNAERKPEPQQQSFSDVTTDIGDELPF